MLFGPLHRKKRLQVCTLALTLRLRLSSEKEVIQPQVPLRLPCYDLVPVTSLAVGTDESRRLKALPASMT